MHDKSTEKFIESRRMSGGRKSDKGILTCAAEGRRRSQEDTHDNESEVNGD